MIAVEVLCFYGNFVLKYLNSMVKILTRLPCF